LTEEKWLKEFAKKLGVLIGEAGITQHALAQSIGVADPSISNYLRGKQMPNARTIVNLAHAFKCDVGDLIDFGGPID
jgi:transcriptional regulator with XRE-family HTH domain